MKKVIKTNKMFLKIVFVFCILINLSITCMASIEFDKKLELIETKLNLDSNVSIMTILIGFILIVAAFFIIVISLFFINKIPRTALYIIITLCVLVICIIAILFGEEITAFCNEILKLQMEIVTRNM